MTLSEIVKYIGTLADKPGDDSETLLHHKMLIYAGLVMSCGGLLWGSISSALGLHLESLIPFGYIVITIINFIFLNITKNFKVASYVQISASLLLPFFFQWMLGGFLSSGAIMLWSMLALVGSIAIGRRNELLIWLGLYIGLAIFSAFIETDLAPPAAINTDFLRMLFYVINIVAVTSAVFTLTFYFAKGREAALIELAAKHRELNQSHKALAQSEKLAALGQLVAGVAHEINTPIGAIRASATNLVRATPLIWKNIPSIAEKSTDEEFDSFISLLESINAKYQSTSKEDRLSRKRIQAELEELSISNSEDIAEMLIDAGIYKLEQDFIPTLKSEISSTVIKCFSSVSSVLKNGANISEAADRSAKIVFALKSYSHTAQDQTPTQQDIAVGLETALTVYHNQIKHGVVVEKTFSKNTKISAFHDQLNQVWTNLISNALDAMNYSGLLTIETLDTKNGITVNICNDGPVISKEILSKIFDPFYTTKDIGEGTGLGLSICNDIIELHDGKFTVDSQSGLTCFSVFLPYTSEL